MFRNCFIEEMLIGFEGLLSMFQAGSSGILDGKNLLNMEEVEVKRRCKLSEETAGC